MGMQKRPASPNTRSPIFESEAVLESPGKVIQHQWLGCFARHLQILHQRNKPAAMGSSPKVQLQN